MELLKLEEPKKQLIDIRFKDKRLITNAFEIEEIYLDNHPFDTEKFAVEITTSTRPFIFVSDSFSDANAFVDSIHAKLKNIKGE